MNNEHPNFNESAQDAQLRQLLQSHLPVASPSQALQERVARLAAQTSQSSPQPAQTRSSHTRRSYTTRLALSMATLAFLVIVGSIVWPRVLARQAIARVDAALAQVASVHFERFRIEGAQRIKETDQWFDRGKWRTDYKEQGSTSLYVNGTTWFYDSAKQTVTVDKNSKGPFYRNPSGFTLSNLIHDFGNRGSTTTVSLQGTTTQDGRTLKRAVLDNSDDYETTHLLLLVDTETDLPASADMRVRNVYGKEGHWQLTFAYNEPLPPQLFQPNFGPSVRFVTAKPNTPSLDDNKVLVKGMIRGQVADRTLAIRALEVNPDGTVFLFYTAGKKLEDAFSDGKNAFPGQDWKVFLEDSLGTQYEWMRGSSLRYGSLQPHTVQGERLESDWWVPLKAPGPGQKWSARTFTVRFKLNSQNLHGDEKAKFPADYSQEAEFTVPVKSTTPTIVPSIINDLGIQFPEKDLVKQEHETRGELPMGVQPSEELVRELDANGTFSPDSTQLAIGKSGRVQLLRLSDGQITRELETPTAMARAQDVTFSPKGDLLFARFNLGTSGKSGWQCYVWNVTSGQILATWHWQAEHDVDLRDLQMAPDGKTLRALSMVITKSGGTGSDQWVEDSDVRVEERDASTGKVLSQHILPQEGFALSILQSGPGDSSWKVVTGQTSSKAQFDGKVRVWDGKSGQLLVTLPVPSDYRANRVARGGDGAGALVATVSARVVRGQVRLSGLNQIQLYSEITGQLLQSVTPQVEDYVASLALSPDGKWLAAENGDHTVGLWNAQTGRLERSLVGHYSKIGSFQFSPNSKMLVTSDIKDKTLLWRVP